MQGIRDRVKNALSYGPLSSRRSLHHPERSPHIARSFIPKGLRQASPPISSSHTFSTSTPTSNWYSSRLFSSHHEDLQIGQQNTGPQSADLGKSDVIQGFHQSHLRPKMGNASWTNRTSVSECSIRSAWPEALLAFMSLGHDAREVGFRSLVSLLND